jgi:hypothetical protein
MYVMNGRSGDGCLIVRHPGPCEFKKRQGLFAAQNGRCAWQFGEGAGPEGDPAWACKSRWSPCGTFLTPPCHKGGCGERERDQTTTSFFWEEKLVRENKREREDASAERARNGTMYVSWA